MKELNLIQKIIKKKIEQKPKSVDSSLLSDSEESIYKRLERAELRDAARKPIKEKATNYVRHKHVRAAENYCPGIKKYVNDLIKGRNIVSHIDSHMLIGSHIDLNNYHLCLDLPPVEAHPKAFMHALMYIIISDIYHSYKEEEAMFSGM